MRKTITICIALAMLSMLVPAVQAYTVNTHYDLAPGARVINTASPREGLTYTRGPICPESWNDLTSEDDGLLAATCPVVREANGGKAIHIGVYDIGADADAYTKLTVSVADANFDATYATGCVWTGEDNICDDDDISASGCSSLVLDSGGVLFGDEVETTVFISGVVLDGDTFDICLGSQGDVTGVFS